MIEEKVIKMGAPWPVFSVMIPQEVVSDLKIDSKTVLTFRKTIIDDGVGGEGVYGYTIEKKISAEERE